MTWATRTTKNRNHRDGIHDTLSIFSWISDPAYPPVLKLWLWDIPFYLASFCATMWFNIILWTCECIHQRWWSHCTLCWGVIEVPIHLRAAQEDFNVIVLKGLFHQLPATNDECTRHNAQNDQCERWKTTKSTAVLWGSFWPISSMIFVQCFQLCSIQFPSMNFIVSQSTTTLHSHGCFFPNKNPPGSEVMLTVGCRIIWSWKMLSFWGGLQFSTNPSTAWPNAFNGVKLSSPNA